MFQRIVERMTKKLTALTSPTMMIMVCCFSREKALGVSWRFSLVPLSLLLQMLISMVSSMIWPTNPNYMENRAPDDSCVIKLAS